MKEKIVGVTELQRHFRKVLDGVVNEGTPVILTRGSRPEAVIVPYEQYQPTREKTVDELRESVLRWMEERRGINTEFSEEEIAADIEAAREAVYQERIAREKAGRNGA